MKKQQKNLKYSILECIDGVIGYYEDEKNIPVIERLGEQVRNYRKRFRKN